jgi:hypothetical protein
MLKLLNSMLRLSAAVTVYSMQEVQTAVDGVHPRESVDKLREMIDSLADAVTSKINESKRPTLDSLSNLGHDFVDRTQEVVGKTQDAVDRTIETLKVPAMSPRNIVHTTNLAVKSTTDWLDGIVKPSSASEPKKVAEVALAAH